MATNYFEMMRDTVGSFGEGVDTGRRRKRENEQAERERLEFEQRQRDWAEQNARRAELNEAIGGLRTTQEGVLTGQATGLSDPSAQMLYSQGYGGATGTAAVRAAAGDNALEERRLGLQYTADPSGEVKTRKATDSEVTRAAQRVALAQRDMAAWGKLEADARSTAMAEARRAEFKRLREMKPEELVGLFQQSVNDNPEVPAMVDFDPKTRKYVMVSKIPGIPTQQLSHAEMLQAVMGAWEAGNGDYSAGVQAMVQSAQSQRAMQDKNFERSRGLATNNADLYFKGRAADNDDLKTRATQASAGASREYYGLLRKEREDLAKSHQEALKLAEQYEQLTPQDQAGPKGQGLIRRFNILNSKPGSMVPLGAAPRVEKPVDARLQQQLTDAYVAELTAARDPKQRQMIQNKYRELGLQGIGEDPILVKLREATGGSGAAPAGGLQVPDRPFYNERTDRLQQLARKPQGVSTQEANAARDELERRRGESRIGAF